jgi:hypothetical protein
VQQGVALENFIHEQNMAMFKRLLADEPAMDQKRREMILRLLADEAAKDHSENHWIDPGSRQTLSVPEISQT